MFKSNKKKEISLEMVEIAVAMDNHCQIMYDEFCKLLKERGMSDEDILKTNLHLHCNSTNALVGRMRGLSRHVYKN